jgi:amino acid adenylation domain-containing protein
MGELQLTLSQSISESLNRLARELMVTQATVFQGLFAFLLARMSGLDEIVIGSVRHGRSSMLPGIDRALGLFINTLPVYLNLTPGISFADWLRAQQSELIEQEAHEHIGLTEIQSLAGFPSESLFDALFVFENYPVNTVKEAAGDLVVSHAQAIDGNHYPIALSVVPGISILMRLTFDQSRIDQHQAKDFLSRLQEMVAQLPACVNDSLATLPYTTTHERKKLLEQSSGLKIHDALNALTLADLLSMQASATPEKTALCFVRPESQIETHISYGELEASSNRLARHLITKGIGPDQVVAIMLDRSPEMIIAILAVLKAGGAYLPLDSSYPASRLNFMVSDSRTKHLITAGSSIQGTLDSTIIQKLTVLDIVDILNSDQLSEFSSAKISDVDRAAPLLTDNLAYLIYTSGSTGLPKGVGFLHGALSNLIRWQDATSPDLPACVLQYSPISFDVSAQEIIATLTRGAKLVLVEESSRKDGLAMLDYIDQRKIDLLHVPYVVLSNLAQASRNYDHSVWPATIITAGEQLQITPEIRQTFLDHPGTTLYNHYGPTETHVVSSFTLSNHPDQWDEFPPIGKPIWNTQIYILDSTLALVPDGVVGELYIAGESLARGYLNRAALTSERFIANPFGVPGSRMYRTGDLAHRSSDGEIYYAGRVDDQVKIRGFRIELGEVEAALLKLIPDVAQVAVISSISNGNKRLIAYIVMNASVPMPEPLGLRALLAQSLPDYMVPAHFIHLTALPLTPNGKLDRRTLPEPGSFSSNHSHTAPRSAREAYLCRLFAELTNTDPVGIDDNFFDIGGHSLLAMQLVSNLKITLGIKLNLRVLFDNPTPRQLAANLDESSNWTYDPLLPLRKTGSKNPIFCVHPGGGTGTVYQNITDALPDEYPVWALQAKGLEDNEVPHTDVWEMAKEYVEAIRKIQPEGPYHLLGWSFGGTIAQEMAVQLESMSQKVELLVLLDTVAKPDLMQTEEISDEEQSKNILENSAQSLGITDEIIDLNNDPFIREMIRKMSLHRLIPESTPLETFKRTVTQMIRATKLTASHPIRKCEASIIFVRAALEPQPQDPSLFDWSIHTNSGVTQVDINTLHSAMWETQPSNEIARLISNHLQTIQSVNSDSFTNDGH